MSIKDDLEIFLITFNRKDKLKETFDKLLSENSPIKDFDIKILDNESTDGTKELCEEYARRFSNLTYIRNKINLGISGNIIKAMEIASKNWLWVLCDDDDYDWSNWGEIETALEQDYDVVHTTYSGGFRNETYPYTINEEAFIPAAIYNTKHITPLTMQNAYAMAYTLLPHHAIGCKIINEKGKIFVPQNKCVLQSYDDKCNFVRMSKKGLFHKLDKYQLLAGYIGAYQLIEDEKTRHECCNVLCLGNDFKGSMEWFYENNDFYPYNIVEIYLGVNTEQRTQLLEVLASKLSSKDKEIVLKLIRGINKLINKNKPTFLQKIFLLKNEDKHKIIRILGIKIKIKRKGT